MNYDLEMSRMLEGLGNIRPKLLLHSCCAPCSIPALGRLGEYFDITVYYYNPNIADFEEFSKRLDEQSRLSAALAYKLVVPEYNHSEFLETVSGLENEPEGGSRCKKCFELRLENAARYASEGGFGYLAATITTGPRKNAETVNACGEAAVLETAVRWLPADFKKRGGYQESVSESKRLGIYRQDFCGCEFSIRD